jgi:deoxyadenosine/deoxycytidine kinase
MMNERDWTMYRELYTVLTEFLTAPDLVIYLRSSVDTLRTRIQKRGREFEQDIDPHYLHRLNMLYEDWIERFTLSPVLIVPADALDFVMYPSHLDMIVAKIHEKLEGKDEVSFLAEEIANLNPVAA